MVAAPVGQIRAQGRRVFSVVEHQQPGGGACPHLAEPALECQARWFTLADGGADEPATVERIELQRGVGLGAKPPHAGIAIAELKAVFQCQLRLAHAAHAVDRGGRHDGGRARRLKRALQCGQGVVRVAEMRTQGLLDDAKRLREADRCAKAWSGDTVNLGQQFTQADELLVPVGILALEYVDVE